MKRYVSLFLFISAFTAAHGDSPPLAAAPDCRARYKAGDYAEALRVCSRLAEAGDANAPYYLGRMYERAEGVSKDLETALRWYRRAAEKGHAASQQRVAVAYALGLGGVQKDEAKAIEWLKRAAAAGDRRAQMQLAEGYQRGLLGLPHDEQLAQQWRERAEKSRRQ